jgi:5-methylcytosine-specific restriction endonuclease McrA
VFVSKPVVACEFCEKPARQRGMCNSHYQRVWRIENEDKYLARCRDKLLQREQYRRHRTARLGYQAKARAALDPVEQAAYMRAYFLSHRDEIRDSHREYRAANAPAVREYRRRHQALKRGAPVSDFTLEQWEAIKLAFGGHCAYCGVECASPEQEHIIALSKGGSHTASNIVPACRSCNARKSAMPVEDFMARLEAEGTIAIHELS